MAEEDEGLLAAFLNGFTVVAYSPATNDSFSVIDNAGAVSHTCTGTGGGCANSNW